MKKKKTILILIGLILSIYSVSAQTSLCDLPPDTPKPESCNTGLNYNILDSEITDKTTDQDIFIPRVKIDTNAENVYIEIGSKAKQLYNDGNHEDYTPTDQWYGNSIDISNTIGEKNIILKLEKGTETETKHLQTTKFKRTPPEPDIDAEFNDQGLLIQITDTNYPEETSIEIETSVTNEGNTKLDKTISINCKSDCTRQASFNPEAGDNAEIEATQTYNSLKGDKEKKILTYAGEPSIEAVKYSRSFDNIPSKVAADSYWMAGTVGLSAVNFEEEDIKNFNYTYKGQKIGNWDEKPGVAIDLYQELESYGGNNIFIGKYNFSGAEISGGIGTNVQIVFNAELSSGQTVSKKLETIEIVEDNGDPSLVDDPHVWHINSSSVDISLDIKDDLQNQVECKAYVSETDELIGDCSTELDSPQGEAHTDLETDMPENIDDVINIDIELDDGSGNTHTETLGPYLVKSQSLKPVEKNGDPREKMNILIIGNEMSTSETEDALEERLNWYFNQGDMEIHKKYRDFFNWYILDTEKRICSKDIGGLDSDDDCPAMEESGDLLSQSDEIKGGHLSYIVMSSQDFRSYAGYSSSLRGRSVIADQQPWGDDNVFAHELGHLIWGFDDEYGFDNTITGAGRTYGFFTHSDETENFNIEKYSNTFPQEQNCKSNMSTYYPRLDQSDCWYQDAEEPGWIVRTASKGESLMSGDPPIYYQTHKKRIKYLIENNPIYEGVIN